MGQSGYDNRTSFPRTGVRPWTGVRVPAVVALLPFRLRHFGVAPRLTDIVFAVHEAGKAFFETALGKEQGGAGGRPHLGNGQGCPRGPDRSLLPLTVVIRAVQILAARGFVYAAPAGFERGVPQFWMADDGAFVSDCVEGVQLLFEAVWLTSLVLGLEIGWDVDASKTAWLARRWEGNRQVPDETSRVTLPLGPDGADVDMPRVTDHYRHLGSEVTSRVDHSALRARIEARVRTLLRMVGKLGGALAGRAEGRRAAAEKAGEVVGARPVHITSQLWSGASTPKWSGASSTPSGAARRRPQVTRLSPNT